MRAENDADRGADRHANTHADAQVAHARLTIVVQLATPCIVSQDTAALEMLEIEDDLVMPAVAESFC